MMKRLFLFLFILLIQSPCFGQANLAIISEGKTVGWLLTKKAPESYDYLTPDGYLMTLDRLGFFVSKSGILQYESADCSTQPFTESPLYGELFQVGNSQSPLFVTLGYTVERERRSILSETTPDGLGCQPWGSDPMRDVLAVTPIDPAAYGIKNVDGRWGIPIDSRVVQRPDGMFCDSFESCPEP